MEQFLTTLTKKPAESVSDLPLNIGKVELNIHFLFLLFFLPFSHFQFVLTFFYALPLYIWYCVIYHFGTHRPELYNMLIVGCLSLDAFHFGNILFEIIETCHSYSPVSLLPSSDEGREIFYILFLSVFTACINSATKRRSGSFWILYYDVRFTQSEKIDG